MIDLTPLEVRKKKGDFRRAMRGYEPAQVDDFLDIVADRLEQVVREHTALKDRVGGLERQVTEYRERERALTDALVTAQTMREEIRAKTTQETDELKQRAEQDAGSRVQQAQQQAEVLLHKAREEAESQLQRARQEAESQLQRAEQEAESQLQRAEQEVHRLRSAAAEEVGRLRSAASDLRQRESDLLLELRERQMQLLNSYRGFLERELNELKVMAETIETSVDDLPPLPPLPEPVPPSPATARVPEVRAASAPEPAAVAPPAAPLPAPVAAAAPPAAPAPEPAPAEPVDLKAIIADATKGIATVGLDPLTGEQLPPFEPEQVFDEDLAGAADDDEAARLLENAERAGYRIELIDDEGDAAEELLLEEDAPNERPDDDWLSTMIRDEK
jgi:DivIVA domain-containing protein